MYLSSLSSLKGCRDLLVTAVKVVIRLVEAMTMNTAITAFDAMSRDTTSSSATANPVVDAVLMERHTESRKLLPSAVRMTASTRVMAA